MLIIDRIVWFIRSGIEIFIVAVIALMLVRLIADAMDLNPFAWTSRTVRRLSDGFVIPVRGGLRQLGMDPKFAPLAVILVVILLGYYFLWLVRTIASTIAGVWMSVQSGAGFAVLLGALIGIEREKRKEEGHDASGIAGL